MTDACWVIARNAILLALLGSCTVANAPAREEPPGTLELNQTTKDYSAGGGSGTVFLRNGAYHFAVGGLGVNGAAVAIIQTTGEVYRLENIGRFAGTYRQTNDPLIGSARGDAGLWLQNEHGTIIHLKVPPQGRMPALNGDAVRVTLD